MAPFYIDADATPNAGGWPKGGVTRLSLPNDHLQYAITWFSLAIAMIVIYVLFHRRNAESPMSAYQQLEARFRRLGAIEEAIGVLNWDCATMMPPGGAATRAEQLATLSLLAHQQLTATEIGDLLAEAEGVSDALDPWQRGNLREMRRRRSHAAAVPGALVEALSRVSSECETVWRKARPANDFPAVLPLLDEMLRVQREVAFGQGG